MLLFNIPRKMVVKMFMINIRIQMFLLETRQILTEPRVPEHCTGCDRRRGALALLFSSRNQSAPAVFIVRKKFYTYRIWCCVYVRAYYTQLFGRSTSSRIIYTYIL